MSATIQASTDPVGENEASGPALQRNSFGNRQSSINKKQYKKAVNDDVAPSAGVESDVDLLDVQIKVEDSSENKDQGQKLFTADNKVPASDEVDSPPNDNREREFPRLDDQEAQSIGKAVEFKSTPYRWAVLLSFSACIFMNMIINVGFTTIAVRLATAYELESPLQVNMCSMARPFMAIPLTLAAVGLFQKFRYSDIIRWAVAFQFVGIWLRSFVFVTDTFWIVQVGTFISAASSPVFMSSQSIIAQKWFPDNERALAVAIPNAGIPLATILALIITAYIFKDETVDPKEHLYNLMKVQNICALGVFVALQATIREQPPFPPSRSALEKTQSNDFIGAFKQLRHNRNYVLLMVVFSMNYGIFGAVGTLLSSICDPLGMTPVDISIIGGVLLLSGALSAPFIGTLLDRTRKYALIFRTICVCMTISLLCAYFTLQYRDTYWALTLVNVGVIGFFAVAFIPASLSFACELTFPMQASLSNGLLFIIGSTFAILLGVVGTYLANIRPELEQELGTELFQKKKKDMALLTMVLFGVCALVSAILSFFIEEDLRRLKFDDAHAAGIAEEGEEIGLEMEKVNHSAQA